MRRFFQNKNNKDQSLEKILEEIKTLKKNTTSVNPEDILRYSITQEARRVTQEEISKANKAITLIGTTIIALLAFFIGDKYDDFKGFLENQRNNSEKIFQDQAKIKVEEAKKKIQDETQRNIDNFNRNTPNAEEMRSLQNRYSELNSRYRELDSQVSNLNKMKEQLTNNLASNLARVVDLEENANSIDSLPKIEERLMNLLGNISRKINDNSRDGSIDDMYDPTRIVSAAIEGAVQENRSSISNRNRGEFYVYIGTSSASEPLVLKNSKFEIYNTEGTVNISSTTLLNNRTVLQAKSGVRTRSAMPSINSETGNLQLAEEVGIPLNKNEKVLISDTPKHISLPNGDLYHVVKVRRQNN